MFRSEETEKLFKIMQRMGYPVEFCHVVCTQLQTDFTAGRMIRYLSHYERPSFEEVADEMVAILSDRDKYREKKILENSQSKWNHYLRNGFGD